MKRAVIGLSAILFAALSLWWWSPSQTPATISPKTVSSTPKSSERPHDVSPAPRLPFVALERQPPDPEGDKPLPVRPIPGEDPAETENRLVAALLTEAEQAFEDANLEVATSLFLEIVEQHPDAKLAPYAAYKLAWCRFNEGDRVEAIESLELLIHWLDTTPVAGARELSEEANKDLATFRATNDDPPDQE